MVANGTEGVLYELSSLSTSAPSSPDEKLEWTSPPVAVAVVSPVIISLTAAQVDIHDLSTLSLLQSIKFSAPVPSYICSLATAVNPNARHTIFASSSDAIFVLPIVPLTKQISELEERGQYEHALSLCALLSDSDPEVLAYISVPSIHEKNARSIYNKGDFDGAIAHFLLAETPFMSVLGLFPDIVPQQLQQKYGLCAPAAAPVAAAATADGGGNSSSSSSSRRAQKLPKEIVARAALALVQYCERLRPAVKALADNSDKQTTRSLSAIAISGYNPSLSASFSSYGDPSGTAFDDVDDAVREAIVLDTVLLAAYVNCAPPRRAAVVDLLSKPNRCQMESSSLLLSGLGNAFTGESS